MIDAIVTVAQVLAAVCVIAVWAVLLGACVQWMLTDRRAWRNRRPGYVSDFWGPGGSERRPDKRLPL